LFANRRAQIQVHLSGLGDFEEVLDVALLLSHPSDAHFACLTDESERSESANLVVERVRQIRPELKRRAGRELLEMPSFGFCEEVGNQKLKRANLVALPLLLSLQLPILDRPAAWKFDAFEDGTQPRQETRG